MLRSLLILADRHARHLPGWLMLLGGMVLVYAAVLVPAWLEARELAWQRQVMTLQRDRVLEHERKYVQFREALDRNDPTVLTRLALTQLRLKPVGAAPVGLAVEDPTTGYAVQYVSDPNDPDSCVRLIRQCLDKPETVSIERMLHTPMPREGVDYQPLPPVQKRLVRMASGRMRLPLAAAGLLCIAAGLVPPGREG